MIGLRRGTVRLVKHQATWHKVFKIERRKLWRGLGDRIIDIQHIGSTAIPGIMAKPIIDILLGVESVQRFRQNIKIVEGLGYHWRKEYPIPAWQLFFTKGPEKKRTVYLHVVRFGGALWGKDLWFRDYLRSNPTARNKYEKVKVGLASKFSSDRKSYTTGKQNFILSVIRKMV